MDDGIGNFFLSQQSDFWMNIVYFTYEEYLPS